MINSKPKYLVQYYINNKNPMEDSKRLISYDYIQDDDRGVVLVPLSKVNPNRTFKIWKIAYNEAYTNGLNYTPYDGEVGFKE